MSPIELKKRTKAFGWLELLVEAGLVSSTRVEELMAEGREILAIMVASAKTARSNTSHPAANGRSTRVETIANRKL